MQLSENFALAEFLRSETAARMGRPLLPPPFVVENLKRLCQTVLQPIRDEIAVIEGKVHPVTVTSGWRPDWLNRAIGGSRSSAHLSGLAVDFRVVWMTNFEVATFVAGIIDRLPIDQLIYEYGQWIHIGLAPDGQEPRREILTAVRDADLRKTFYLPGLLQQPGDN